MRHCWCGRNPPTRSLLFYTHYSVCVGMPSKLKVSQLHSLQWLLHNITQPAAVLQMKVSQWLCGYFEHIISKAGRGTEQVWRICSLLDSCVPTDRDVFLRGWLRLMLSDISHEAGSLTEIAIVLKLQACYWITQIIFMPLSDQIKISALGLDFSFH